MAARWLVVADGHDTADRILGALDATAGAACILAGCDVAEATRQALALPVERVLVAPDAPVDAPPDRLGPLLLEHMDDDTTMLLDSSQAARDLAGWLAVEARAQLAWAAERVEPAAGGGVRVARRANGGDLRLVQELGTPAVVLTRASVRASADPRQVGAPRPLVETISTAIERVGERLAAEDSGGGGIPLASAGIVVAVGRGIGGPEHVAVFRELAERLGAGLGATRVAVDRGWLPFGHQLGQTGAAVAPDLYLGFGVSGAVQHLAGIRESRTIVAVNTDPHAPLCHQADLVIEADALEVARGLLSALEAKAGAPT